jgi:hypothetical protein
VKMDGPHAEAIGLRRDHRKRGHMRLEHTKRASQKKRCPRIDLPHVQQSAHHPHNTRKHHTSLDTAKEKKKTSTNAHKQPGKQTGRQAKSEHGDRRHECHGALPYTLLRRHHRHLRWMPLVHIRTCVSDVHCLCGFIFFFLSSFALFSRGNQKEEAHKCVWQPRERVRQEKSENTPQGCVYVAAASQLPPPPPCFRFLFASFFFSRC